MRDDDWKLATRLKASIVLAAVLLGVAPGLATASCTLTQLEIAEAQWTRSGYSHYSYAVTRSMGIIVLISRGVPVPSHVSVEIKGGKIRSVRDLSIQDFRHPDGVKVPRWMWKDMTIKADDLFTEVRKAIAEAEGDPDRTIRCEFDPSTGLLRSLETDVRNVSDARRAFGVSDWREMKP